MTATNYTLCTGGDISAQQANSYGIITSPNYPQWEPEINCGKKIVTSIGNIIRVYLNDISIDNKDNANE